MKNLDSKSHVRGESVYLDDIAELQDTLFACVFDSPVAHGVLKSVDISEAEKCEGVFKIVLAKDLVGENEIGGIILDEPLLADEVVHFAGMPIAIVLAETEEFARKAVKKISVEIEPLEVITDSRIAHSKGDLIGEPKRFTLGDSVDAFDNCEYVFEGKADTNGQEHLYIETQGAYTTPMENGGIRVYSSTQGPTAVQRTISRVTGIPMHKIEVDVTRLGGGFGGKEDQANAWAAICAVGTQLTKRPVKYALHRMEDMRMTGKRHPYSSDYKIGFDKNLKIIAYEASFFQNAGAAADLSLPVLERTLFHCTNSYFIPNVSVVAYSCRTNLPPNTAFRGFGGPQGIFVIESAIVHAAEELGVSPSEIQRKNLIENGDEFPYGQIAESEAISSWNQADGEFDFAKLHSDAEEFNKTSKYLKKGVAIMPICFGISFTKTPMNQARSLVHVYTDGSVAISTGAVEMGQGVNTKMAQVAEATFSMPIANVRVHTTNTLRIANTSPTAASAAADLNGKATLMACEAILGRLKEVAKELIDDGKFGISSLDGIFETAEIPPEGGTQKANREASKIPSEGETQKANREASKIPSEGETQKANREASKIPSEGGTQKANREASKIPPEGGTQNGVSIQDGFVYFDNKKTDLDWKRLVIEAHERRVSLSEHSHYATPGINFDWSIAKGHPFAYHVYGTAIVAVTVDCLRGIYEVDYVKNCHDFGKSMNTAVDVGQIEGGIVQGIGWMTMEEIVYDEDGILRSNALSTYKVPDIYSVPKEIETIPLKTDRDNLAIFRSKAVGEPPLIYGLGAYFAIRDAVKAFRKDATAHANATDLSPEFDAPFTPEKVLMNLYSV